MVSSVAVLSDIHGVMPALDAVVAEPDLQRADRIVLTGDIAAGPQPTEVLDRLLDLGDTVVWVRGNADRELVELARGVVDDVGDAIASWAAKQLGPRHGWTRTVGYEGQDGQPWGLESCDYDGRELRLTVQTYRPLPPDVRPWVRVAVAVALVEFAARRLRRRATREEPEARRTDLIDRVSRDVAQRTPSRDRLLVNGLAVACESLTYEEFRTQLATVDDLTVVCSTAPPEMHQGWAFKLKRPGGLTDHGAPDDRAREARL
jgi:hypothetical protein